MNISLMYSMFLGDSPRWYKQAILSFLIINPILLIVLNSLGLNGGFIMGWIILLQFIFTLALALKCYPLQPGGLLAIEALVMDLSNPYSMMHEIEANIEVILLLVFMVAGIFFMKNLMLTIFTKLLLNVKSKVWLSLLYCFTAAFLSAFLDALTVTAVLIGVTVGFYRIYHLIISNKYFDDTTHDIHNDASIDSLKVEELDDFKGFLRQLIMHGAVGTALGGVCTIVGEPQNLLIAKIAGWNFMEFFLYMAPVTMPVFVAGLILCFCLERFKLAGFGSELPDNIRAIFLEYASYENKKNEHDSKMKAELAIELFVLVLLAIIFVKFNTKAHPKATKTTHNTFLEIAWTAIPVLILVIMAVPSFKLLYKADVIPEAHMTLKAIGHQWYWSYEYPDHGNFTYDAWLVQDKEDIEGEDRPFTRLLTTDTRVVVPVGKVIRVQITATDVLHSWAVPSLGVKKDAMPGRLNELWFQADREGIFYGQCSELCGTNHGYMPIEVHAVSEEEFLAWIEEAKENYAKVGEDLNLAKVKE